MTTLSTLEELPNAAGDLQSSAQTAPEPSSWPAQIFDIPFISMELEVDADFPPCSASEIVFASVDSSDGKGRSWFVISDAAEMQALKRRYPNCRFFIGGKILDLMLSDTTHPVRQYMAEALGRELRNAKSLASLLRQEISERRRIGIETFQRKFPKITSLMLWIRQKLSRIEEE